jgi:histidine triad (HIT) family protein
VLEIDEASWLAVMKTVHLLAPAIMKAVQADGININMNNEAAAGQVVFHTHIHLIPRYAGDGFKTFTPGTYAYPDQQIEVGEKIRNALA